MAKDNEKQDVNDKDITALDKVAKKFLSAIDPTYNERMIVSDKNNRFRNIINRELDIAKGVSSGSIIDFIATANKATNKPKTREIGLSADSSDLFTKNIGDIFGYFQDIHRNRFIEMTDLKFISKFIPSLGEAVRTTLDSIVSSDDVADTINRTIVLPANIGNDDKATILNEIKRFETEHKLLKNLKNTVYKKTLVTGQFYVYAIPYQKLFNDYEQMLKNAENGYGKARSKGIHRNKSLANEQTMDMNDLSEKEDDGYIKYNKVIESYANILKTAPSLISNPNTGINTKLPTTEASSLADSFKNMLPKVKLNDSPVYYEAMEGVMTIINSNMIDMFQVSTEASTGEEKKESEDTDISSATVEGVKDTNESPASTGKYNVPGTYIKYIDSKNIIPVTVFNRRVGYYLIHSTPRNGKKPVTGNDGITSLGNMIFSSVNVSERKKEEAVSEIVDTISDGIISQFSSKFVTENSEYKKLIADCIIANGIVDTDYNVQFIPAEYIKEFKINEDDDGNGVSMLAESLFPAKSLLSLIVCRLLNYVNKTGNKTIAHVHRNSLDNYTTNQINRVVRDLQDSDITFNDLLSPNIVFNKFNRDGKISMPTSRTGNKLVEFETQEGQTIDMSPDYENKLEAMAVLGTGVPTIIMDYTGSADFAKQYVSANIKFAGRIASDQADLEEPTTELYRQGVADSALPDRLKKICKTGLFFKLPRPKVLVNGNNNDFMRTITETAGMIADVYLGQDNKDSAMKTKLIAKIVKANSPYFDWDAVEQMYSECKAEASRPKDKDNTDEL